jgi:hypothetical protein
MPILNVGVGFVMLLVGRSAYAAFVGGVGYLIGVYLASVIQIAPSGWSDVVLPLLFTLFGALAAFAFRRWAARLAGFIAGGYLITYLPGIFGGGQGWIPSWIFFLVAGMISFLLLILSFDFSLVILSTLVGTTLILRSMSFGNLDNATMFIVLLFFGVIAQYLMLQYGRPYPD